MKTLTLGFLFRENKILLAMKKRKFGEGKWNGYGGKLEDGESSLDGLMREIKEESGLDIKKDACKELGFLSFYFDDKNEWDQSVVVYRIDDFSGEPQETEEMSPRWFEIEKIPWNEMWVGDDEWIPNVIANKKFKGEIHFSKSGEKLVSCVLE